MTNGAPALWHRECYLCGSAESSVLYRVPPYTIWRCRSCDLVFLAPQPSQEELLAVYGPAYWASPSAKDLGYTDYLRDRLRWADTYRRRCRLITERLQPGDALDIGCAAGFFLSTLRSYGWRCTGVDVSAPMIAYGREHFPEIDFRHGMLLEQALPASGFDLITLWDVVEHLPDPLAILRRAHELLRPEGTLLIETQDIGSLFARLLGRRWHHIKCPEHLYHFTEATLSRLLQQAGFDVTLRTRRHAGKYVSLGFIAERSQRIHPALAKVLSLVRDSQISVYVNPHDEQIVLARRTS